MSYTEQELSVLSAEEREAMTEGREAEETVDAGTDEAAEPVNEAAPEVAQPEAQPENTEADTFTHHYQAPPVEGYEEKAAAFATQKADLRRQMNEGGIDLDQYEAAKDELVAQEMVLREQKLKADIAFDQKNQLESEKWKWEQKRFFRQEENSIYQDKYIGAALNAAVIDLANAQENQHREGSDPWFLQEADRLIRARFGIQPAQAQPQAEQRKPDMRKPDLSVVPKTLAHLPAADIPQTGSVDEFAHIDRLTGLAYEDAVARLSPAERERFRAAA